MDANITIRRRRIKDVTNLPNSGILMSQSEETPSSTSSRSPRLMRTRSSPRVHFSSDPVSSVVEIPRVSVYPPLIPSKDDLECLAPFLSPLGVNVGLFLEDLKTKDVREVGQLAHMDSAMMQELKGVEARGRKVKVVKKALRNYRRYLLKAKQTNTSQDKGVFKVKWRKMDSDLVKVGGNSKGHVIFGNSRKLGEIDSRSNLEQEGDLKNKVLKNKVKCGKSQEVSELSKTRLKHGQTSNCKSARITLKYLEQVVKFKTLNGDSKNKVTGEKSLGKNKLGPGASSSCTDKEKSARLEQIVEFKALSLEIEDAFTSEEVETVTAAKDGFNGNKETASNKTILENDKEGDGRFTNKENSTKSLFDASSCISRNIPKMLLPISSDTFKQKALHSKNDKENVLDGASLFSNRLEKAFSSFEEKLDENLENMSEENRLFFINRISRFQSKLTAIQEKVFNSM